MPPERAADVVRAQIAAMPSARAPSAKSASTTTTTSRRATCSRRSSASQVALARELRLPVVIHTREADDDTFAILHEEGGGDVRGVLHCFTGTPALARRGARARLLPLAGRHRDLSEGAGAARHGPRRAARSAADRNRQPVPRARAASRQAQRAGARRAGGATPLRGRLHAMRARSNSAAQAPPRNFP